MKIPRFALGLGAREEGWLHARLVSFLRQLCAGRGGERRFGAFRCCCQVSMTRASSTDKPSSVRLFFLVSQYLYTPRTAPVGRRFSFCSPRASAKKRKREG